MLREAKKKIKQFLVDRAESFHSRDFPNEQKINMRAPFFAPFRMDVLSSILYLAINLDENRKFVQTKPCAFLLRFFPFERSSAYRKIGYGS